jgi:DNA-binding transcriptional MerR regulator
LGFSLSEIQSAIAAWESDRLTAAEEIAILKDKIASMQQI